jgi:hypothetical protein
VALWDSPDGCQCFDPRQMCRDFNIDVNEDFIRIGDQGEIVFEGDEKIVESEVGHFEIDNDPRLLAAIEKIVTARVLETI